MGSCVPSPLQLRQRSALQSNRRFGWKQSLPDMKDYTPEGLHAVAPLQQAALPAPVPADDPKRSAVPASAKKPRLDSPGEAEEAPGWVLLKVE